MKKQIIVGTALHKSKEVPAYIPQVDIGNGWKNILNPGCYILKESSDGFEICGKCDGAGAGCKECGGRGTKLVPPVDNVQIAEMLLERKVSEIMQAQKVLLNL